MPFPFPARTAARAARRPVALLVALSLAGNLAPGWMLRPWAAAPEGPAPPSGASGAVSLLYPILFVTQIPIAGDFTTIGSTFGNHQAGLQSAGRGGDLYIRYPDGSLKNLTQAAGYGGSGMLTGAEAIAVRDPAIHWDGTRAVFSMVTGAPTQRYQVETYRWQLYEISGLGPADTPVITRVPGQSANYNNVSPVYASDDSLIFTSDMPRNGQPHLYPQRDEYELAPTNSGLWRLDPASGALRLLNHAPSGDFTPMVDSFGRVIFTQWDHLQRDQEADADAGASTPGENCYSGGSEASLPYGTFNYADESAGATALLNDRSEVFPEPRGCREDLLAGTNLAGHTFNHFFPWMMNQDGTESETLNHLGRHELHGYIPASITDDAKVIDYYGQLARFNPRPMNNLFQIEEDPQQPGVYYGVDAPEFGTHAAGQVISLTATPALDADHIAVRYVTHRDTAGTTLTADHSGHYREPVPLSDGTLVAAHTAPAGYESGSGVESDYAFRLRTLALGGHGYWAAAEPLTGGISKTVSYWDPDTLVSYSGEFWELNPVEVRPRIRPPATPHGLAAPEQQMFDAAGVQLGELRAYLMAHNLALVVSRNVTTRDDFDQQQPFNLRVVGGTQTVTGTGRIYEVAYLQFFQADLLRGYTGGYGGTTPRPGRRVLAQPMHDLAAMGVNPGSTGPAGSVALGLDGSMAAFVPAGRALTWQLTDAAGAAVVRERYWLTFQPGEVRVCTSCHGLSDKDQAGHGAPANPPQALQALLEHWQAQNALTERIVLPLVRR
jgi:hypothetical protein